MKSYNSLSIYGNANLVMTGWIENNHIHCQWFLHIEHDKEETADNASKIDVNQLKALKQHQSEEDLLKSWMEMELQTANCELFSLQMKISGKNNKPQPVGNIRFDQRSDFTGMLLFLGKKFPDFFEWMGHRAKFQGMKELVQITQGIVTPES